MANLFRSVLVVLFLAAPALGADLLTRVAAAMPPSDLTDVQKRQLDAVALALLVDDTKLAQKYFHDLSTSYFTKSEKTAALQSIADFVLKKGLLPKDPDAPSRSVELQKKQAILIGLNNARLKVRDHLVTLREILSKNQPAMINEVQLKYDSSGLPRFLALAAKQMELEEIKQEIEKWEGTLNSLNNQAQLANVDLQNTLQRQQQTLQMMSNISKMLYDTAQSVISKIGV